MATGSGGGGGSGYIHRPFGDMGTKGVTTEVRMLLPYGIPGLRGEHFVTVRAGVVRVILMSRHLPATALGWKWNVEP
jgi:hypothetical protein